MQHALQKNISRVVNSQDAMMIAGIPPPRAPNDGNQKPHPESGELQRYALLALAGGGALNRKLAILALFGAAVALGVAIGAIGCFLRGLIELTLGEKKAFCPLEVLLAPCTALGAPFYASHGVSPFLWEAKQVARTRENTRYATGLFPGYYVAAFAWWRIGRQAPVK